MLCANTQGSSASVGVKPKVVGVFKALYFLSLYDESKFLGKTGSGNCYCLKDINPDDTGDLGGTCGNGKYMDKNNPHLGDYFIPGQGQSAFNDPYVL